MSADDSPALAATEALPRSNRQAMLEERLSLLDVMDRGRHVLMVAVAPLLILLAGVLSFQAAWNQGLATVQAQAGHRLALFASAVEGMLNRLERVPATLELNGEVVRLLNPSSTPALARSVNLYLKQLNAQLGSQAVYVMDPRGVVVAASNADQPGGFVGEDLSFRPYFLSALSGQVARHFAIGNTSKQPGYYLANPIHDEGRVVGVAVIKISLAPVQESWSMLGVPAVITDANDVIILSSEPAWLYQSLTSQSMDKVVDWQIKQLYDLHRLRLFPAGEGLSGLTPAQSREGVLVDGTLLGPHLGRTAMAQLLALDKMGWRLWVFSNVDAVRKQAVTVSLLSCVAAGFFCLLWVVVQQRRRLVKQKLMAKRMLEQANTELESKVARRTSALSATNDRLRREIGERIATEQTLRAAQDDLVQAAKLAAVGQMSAGITHELTQPLGAIRTLAGNSSEFLRRGDLDTVDSNLDLITRLADQMGDIVQSLKGFARKASSSPVSLDAAQVVNNALLLFMSRIKADQVTLHNTCQEGIGQVWCERNRLEQVVVNLIGNALDAMRDADRKVLHIELSVQTEGRVHLSVSDTGEGIPPELMPRVFEPFFTTKPHDLGLGLGLSISRDIIRSFQGDIVVENRPEGGARFTIDLPCAP